MVVDDKEFHRLHVELLDRIEQVRREMQSELAAIRADATERITKLEGSNEHITKAVADHLTQWDKQWKNVDCNRKSINSMEKDIASILEWQSIERRIWRRVLQYVISAAAGLLAALVVSWKG